MVRAAWRTGAVALAMGLTLVACGEEEGAKRERLPAAPNIVLVLTDDQDAASVRFMPTVRRELAARGTTYANAYVTTALCCPSRASILTGQYAHNHGVLTNEAPDGGFDGFDDSETLPVWLQAAGYRTGYVGKYLNGYGWPALGNEPDYVPPGWSRWIALANHTEYQMYGYDLNFDGKVRSFGEEPADYQTDVLAGEADKFVRRNAGERPFFLTLAPTAPHDEGVLEGTDAPRNPRPAPRDEGTYEDVELPRPPSFDEADVRDKPGYVRRDPRLRATDIAEYELLYRSRAESLLAVDAAVERLLATLDEVGEGEDTVFVFTSDNGILLGAHRLKAKNVPYPEATRVPLVIAGPGFEAGATEHAQVANIDLAPTLLGLAGAEAGTSVDGVSLRGNLDPGRDLLLEGWDDYGSFSALQTREHLYVEYPRGGERELYDLAADPFQLENLANGEASAKRVAVLAERLAALRECAGTTCRRRGS